MCSNGAQVPTTRSSSSSSRDDIGGCEWIDWCSKSSWVQKIPDPTRMFSLLCLGILFGRFWHATADFPAAVFGLFLNPFVVFYFSTACAADYWGRKHAPAASEPLPVYDRWAAEWYWWNSWMYHAVMDGTSGSLRLVPVVVHQYDRLDTRFPTEHTVPWMIGMIELFVMYPLCLATAYAVLSRSPFRFPLELMTSAVQFMGMIVFVVAELYEGQVHVPALDPVGDGNGNPWANVKFWDENHFVYYWFGFWFCNLIWGVVPYYRMHRAVRESVRAFAVAAEVDKQK